MSSKKFFKVAAPTYHPVACVDIGSNSVRLVVYDGLHRNPTPVFNEKLMCGLGRGLSLTGNLSGEAMARALAALRRFGALIAQIGVEHVYCVATAAAREAKNGADFIAQAEAELGHKITILSGKEEATFAAMGVLSGIPDANGVVGDLGGGSLELVDVRNGKIGAGITLPLGALRLMDASGGSIAKATHLCDEILDRADILTGLAGRTFYAVGGAWRNLARLHIEQTHYPLNVVHNYTIHRDQARTVADLVAHLSGSALRDVKPISKGRTESMPFGALVLERLLERARPARVAFSVFGVREGLLFSKLGARKRATDPLLSACWDFARRYSRSPLHELELIDWTNQVFGHGGLEESPADERLRHAACMLADVGWRAHPDFRAQRSLSMIAHASFVGVDHPGRAFLALTIYDRYDGAKEDAWAESLARLVDEEGLARARVLGEFFRLAYILSAAMPKMLPSIGLAFRGNLLVLSVPKRHAALLGERVEKRLTAVAELVDHKGVIEIV